MKELLPVFNKWLSENKKLTIATVIKTWGSSPRPVGSNMIISDAGDMAGSVSGGCVEGQVIEASKEIIKSTKGKVLSFGISDEEAWQVGLSCGGSLEVYVEPFYNAFEESIWKTINDALTNDIPGVVISSIEGGSIKQAFVLTDGTIVRNGEFNSNHVNEALRCYRERKHQTFEVEGERYFAQVIPPLSQLLIIGAAHITADLVQLAKLYQFKTVVIDPRGIFTNKTHFQVEPDQLLEKYPEEVLDTFLLDAFTYAVILSHDPKIDDNALHVLLKSDVGYIGALGSRKTHAKRVARLKAAGFSEAEIARIHAPIGVDIKAKSPAEIALSIMGELIKTKNEHL